MYKCPVCYFAEMTDPLEDYNICECCGTEFGNDDEIKTHFQLRQEWIAAGCTWFDGLAPALWNAQRQLDHAFNKGN
jgi:hypothetical protein